MSVDDDFPKVAATQKASNLGVAIPSVLPILRRALCLRRGPHALMTWLDNRMAAPPVSQAAANSVLQRLANELIQLTGARRRDLSTDFRRTTLTNVITDTVADAATIERDEETRIDAKPLAVAETTHARETVLVTEDEPSVRRLIRYVLERQGFHVLEAKHGKEALVIAHGFSGRIDLLVTDVNLPEINGIQLARQLTVHRPEMKVLFVSGSTDITVDDSEGKLIGFAFLAKPFSPSELLLKVDEVLCGSALTAPVGTAVDKVNHLTKSGMPVTVESKTNPRQ